MLDWNLRHNVRALELQTMKSERVISYSLLLNKIQFPLCGRDAEGLVTMGWIGVAVQPIGTGAIADPAAARVFAWPLGRRDTAQIKN